MGWYPRGLGAGRCGGGGGGAAAGWRLAHGGPVENWMRGGRGRGFGVWFLGNSFRDLGKIRGMAD